MCYATFVEPCQCVVVLYVRRGNGLLGERSELNSSGTQVPGEKEKKRWPAAVTRLELLWLIGGIQQTFSFFFGRQRVNSI